MKRIQAAPSFEVSGRVFRLVAPQRTGADGGTHEEKETGAQRGCRLTVGFDAAIVELFKEVRNLTWLGFRVPYTLKLAADEAKEKYPLAMSLKATLRAYVSYPGHRRCMTGLH